jgi:hypothetical protein
MDRIRLVAVAALPLLLAAVAAAPDPLRTVAATPWSWSGAPEQPFAHPIVIGPPGPQAIAAPSESIAYRDDRYRTLYVNPGANSMFADDLHMLFPGKLANFSVGIYKPPQTPPTQATFYFYADDPADGGIGALLAGPYLLPNILPEEHAYEVITPDSAEVSRHVWFAVKFSTDFPGLIVADDPVVGVSHDVYWDFDHGGASQLPQPPANFMIEVRLIPGPVAVEPVTWTQIKALYASRIRSPAGHRPP